MTYIIIFILSLIYWLKNIALGVYKEVEYTPRRQYRASNGRYARLSYKHTQNTTNRVKRTVKIFEGDRFINYLYI